MVGVNYVASLSGGKDSLAMVLRLMQEKRPITHVVFFDTGMEYQAVYNNIERIKPIVQAYGAEFVWLRPKVNFLMKMLIRPVQSKSGGIHYGYDWCGGACRWQTSEKISAIKKFIQSIGESVQYVGIAADEPKRIKNEDGKTYPLVEWGMTEKDCLQYCYFNGWDWKESGIDLYSILDRVSCWCCANKNNKELQNIYKYLPDYWEMLKGMQSRIDRPYKGNHGKSIFDFDREFAGDHGRATQDAATAVDPDGHKK